MVSSSLPFSLSSTLHDIASLLPPLVSLVNNVKAYFLIIFSYDRNAICKSIWRKNRVWLGPVVLLVTLFYTHTPLTNLSPILHKRGAGPISIIEYILFLLVSRTGLASL
jgi:hypothetical protein